MRTADGKEVKEGDNIWFCLKKTNEDDNLYVPYMAIVIGDWKENKRFSYFSTEQACQDYINSFNKKLKCKPQSNS